MHFIAALFLGALVIFVWAACAANRAVARHPASLLLRELEEMGRQNQVERRRSRPQPVPPRNRSAPVRTPARIDPRF